MAIKQAACVCGSCGRVMGQKSGANHMLHGVLTILTGGLWVIVWIIVAVANASGDFTCQKCGLPCKKV